MPKSTLLIKEIMHPGCSCNVESMALKLKGVDSASYDPVNQLLHLKYSNTTEKQIVESLEACKCQAGKAPAPHEMLHKGGKMPMDHHAMMEQNLKRRFLVSLLLTVPLLILSPTIQSWFNFSISFPGDQLVLFTLATVITAYGGSFFFNGAKKALFNRMLDMSVLVSIAVLSGYIYSVGATFLFEAPDFYWEISTLVVFLLFGHWMEMRAVRGASGALHELVKLIPPKANLMKGRDVVTVETAALRKGDSILVKPGEKIPMDGNVFEGLSTVNESLITGESKPVSKKVGDDVIGGSINLNGVLKVKVTKTGEETALSQIISLVRDAQASKPKVQKMADRAAHWLTVIAIFTSFFAFTYWMFLASETLVFAVTIAVTVLVIACPHALGLAIPTVTTISTTLAAKNGILVKNGQALEVARNINAVVFDKTGTLTEGKFGVTDIVSMGKWSEKRLLQMAASVELNSEHIIAQGIVEKAKKSKLPLKRTSSFKSYAGKGIKAKIGKTPLLVGNHSLMNENNIDVSGNKIEKLSSEGKTVVFVATNKLEGIIALADSIRKESYDAVKTLKELGIEVHMLTGDNKKTAAYVADELGLTSYFAEVLPQNKDKSVRELQSKGKTVAMVGDGVNDAPALVRADVGVAIGTGTDVAVESADVVLIKNDPRDVAYLMKLSRATMNKMQQNLIWATGYNAVAIPVAAGVLHPWNITLRPEWGALIMATSSIIVVTNALLLKRLKLKD